jgi:GT2 family glycosyltransferase
MPETSLCIINHNGVEHLPPTFVALTAQEWPFSEVLLVDSGSTDSSIQLVQALYPGIRVIRLERNLGPGAARNAGFAAARADRILFMDNDVHLERDTVRHLVAEMDAHPGTLAVAPRVLYDADDAIVQFDSADCHFLGLMATRNADLPLAGLDDTPGDTTSLVTACFLIDRTRWHGGDPFDDSLGFNLEDHDFGVRSVVAGHRLRVQPRARVRHGSGTPGLSYRPGQLPSAERQFYLTRNRWIVVAKCFSTRTLLLLAPALLLFEFTQLVWLTQQRRGSVWFRAVASLWAARHRVGAERRVVQASRGTSDSKILRSAPLPVTRHVRESGVVRKLGPQLDRVLRAHWQLVHRWIP